MKSTTAILVATGQPLVIDEIEIPKLKPGQVLIELHYSGVCHTQLLECRGHRGEDRYLPHCLGHEGSGIVCEVGPAVTKVTGGQRVILSWIKGTGADVPGTQYRWGPRLVNAGAVTTFGQYAVVSENRLTVIPDGLSMTSAALLGCAVPTGCGAVFNTADVSAGESIGIFGTGGVGLCATAAAAAIGCTPIIAIDINQDRLELARQMGATHLCNHESGDLDQKISAICPGGLDVAIEASGRPAVMQTALTNVRNEGGKAVILGNAHFGESLTIDPKQLNLGKQLRGSWGGDSQPDRDFPRYCELIEDGRLDLRLLASDTFSLEQVNDAIAALEIGSVGRPLLKIAA